ncbi:uncharacterized protein BCR38DRAFT_357137 [Pseudomassariella vexata]|uniref:Uncharacterized protein n=1 Tax=Pseudomassariella vexata TaxID=1141098 RepID=A0A1Y2D7K4_9PEZI|nr:uncharacterized protein BCR38DRAFT_357137 [Pseudomassariella vexata]ORY55096.1 hypothetical protein BCR38DRAFT_357137 [Pseudomassariella vexata]
MDDSAGASEGDSSEALREADLPTVIEIVSTGDLVLDVTFENSKATLKSARKAVPRIVVAPAAMTRLGFRVDVATLKRQSKYFEKLLTDTRFREAKAITAALAALSLRNVKPAVAEFKDLPWIQITDDDEATLYAHRDAAFADLLRILHGKAATTSPVTMQFVATLAVLADRFDCAASISRFMSSGLKFKWPITQRKPLPGEDASMSRNTENVLRQKILVAWLLNQPVKFAAATRELIMNGSCKWTSFPESDGQDEPTWWYLQDGLEEELQHRRECILNTIASVQRHFLKLYTSRTRQCKLGYDSSAACDSYQLGEMLKFLTNKNLMFLVDFSPASLDSIADTSLLQIDPVLATLRQCPSYQIDKNHTNCGLRTRILSIVDFLQALLSANSIPIARMQWKTSRHTATWIPTDNEKDKEGVPKLFRFTRAVAGDQRLRFEHAIGADKFARDVFTAPDWNWTAEE